MTRGFIESSIAETDSSPQSEAEWDEGISRTGVEADDEKSVVAPAGCHTGSVSNWETSPSRRCAIMPAEWGRRLRKCGDQRRLRRYHALSAPTTAAVPP